jgi:hypothetical protein
MQTVIKLGYREICWTVSETKLADGDLLRAYVSILYTCA